MVRDKPIEALQCMSLIEEAAAEFYENVSKITRLARCSAALAFIAAESKNHATLLRNLYGEPLPERCPSELGTAGVSSLQKLTQLTQKIKSGWVPSLKELANILEEFVELEHFAGEEVYVQVSAGALSTQFTRLERNLLMMIAEEERRHLEILKLVVEELKSI